VRLAGGYVTAAQVAQYTDPTLPIVPALVDAVVQGIEGLR
jgi:hypothetical protein